MLFVGAHATEKHLEYAWLYCYKELHPSSRLRHNEFIPHPYTFSNLGNTKKENQCRWEVRMDV